MNLTTMPTRMMAGLLALMLVAAAPARSQTNDRDAAFAVLLKSVKEREKVLAKRQKEIRKRLFKVSDDITKARNKGLSEDAAAYAREGDAFVMLKDSIERERDVISDILSVERYGHTSSGDGIGRGMFTANRAASLKRFHDEATRKGIAARVRLEVAQSNGAEVEQLALVRREVAAYEQVFGSLDQEEELLDKYLAIFGGTSVKQIQKNQQAALEASYDRYRRLERERERAREYAAQLAVTVGVVAALVLILKSSDSTPAQIDYARSMMKDLNDQARTACAFRGGMFFEGGPYSVGTCSK